MRIKQFIAGLGIALAVMVGCAPSAPAAQKSQIFQTALAGLRFDGATLSSGKVYFYSPGTTTAKTIYVDRNKQTTAANPYTLDSNGRAEIFGDGTYDVVVKTSAGVTKATWENVALLDVASFDNIDNYASLNAAITAIGATPTRLVINAATTMTGNATVPATLELEVTRAGSINQGAYTLTINGNLIAGDHQVFTGSGTISGLKEARAEWFGATVSDTSIQAAVSSLVSGGVLNLSAVTGTVTLAAPVTISNPVTVLLGNSTITANLTTQMFLVTSSDVTFQGVKGQSKLTSTNTVSGNIIQWGETGTAHTYNDMKVTGIEFTLPLLPGAPSTIDTYRKTLGAIVALTETTAAITANNRLLVEDCVFNEGADQISLEQVNYATIKNNTFNSTKGRGILLWNSDYYLYDGNTFIDTAGTAVNFNESFQSDALNKGCDYGTIVNNTIIGTGYEAIAVKGIGTVVSNNTIKSAKGTGIAITDPDTSQVTVYDVTVTNNFVHVIGGGVGGYGIVVTDSTMDPRDVLIQSNTVAMTGTGTWGIAAQAAGSLNINILNNRIRAYSITSVNVDGVQFNAGSGKVTGNDISGFPRYGIYANGATSAAMINNFNASHGSDGIRLINCHRMFVGDNYASSNGGYGMNVVAGDTTYLQITDTNRYYNNTSGNINTHFYYMGHNTRVDATILPVSGYMEAGDIVWKGSGQTASTSLGWICTTAGWLLKGAWTTGTAYTAGFMVSNAGNIYIATNTGTSGATAPTHGSGTVSDDVVSWRFVAVGAAAVTKTLPVVGS
jgi:parallel beta-helix repeat protein